MTKQVGTTGTSSNLKDLLIIFLLGTLIILWGRESLSSTKYYGTQIATYDQTALTTTTSIGNDVGDRVNPLSIPLGKAEALPSILVKDTETSVDDKRNIYGGKG
jgi:hypothetical protein